MEFSKHELEIILEGLRRVRNKDKSQSSAGICLLLHIEVWDTTKSDNTILTGIWIQQTVESWPEYSGQPRYPIKSYDEDQGPGSKFWSQRARKGLMWDRDDPYCMARWRLLDWLIEQAKEQINAKA